MNGWQSGAPTLVRLCNSANNHGPYTDLHVHGVYILRAKHESVAQDCTVHLSTFAGGPYSAINVPAWGISTAHVTS
jgi:hypothetical protein